MAYKQPTDLGMNLGRQSTTDQGLRDAYQSEIVNQLRGNSFQSADDVWGAVNARRQAPPPQAPAQMSPEMVQQQYQQQISQQIGYNPFVSNDGSTWAGHPVPSEPVASLDQYYLQTLGWNPYSDAGHGGA